jgi:hypothetical protein
MRGISARVLTMESCGVLVMICGVCFRGGLYITMGVFWIVV